MFKKGDKVTVSRLGVIVERDETEEDGFEMDLDGLARNMEAVHAGVMRRVKREMGEDMARDKGVWSESGGEMDVIDLETDSEGAVVCEELEVAGAVGEEKVREDGGVEVSGREEVLGELRELETGLREARGVAREVWRTVPLAAEGEARALKRMVRLACRRAKRVRRGVEKVLRRVEVGTDEAGNGEDGTGDEAGGEIVERPGVCGEEERKESLGGVVREARGEVSREEGGSGDGGRGRAPAPFGSLVVCGVEDGVTEGELVQAVRAMVPAARGMPEGEFRRACRQRNVRLAGTEQGRRDVVLRMPTFVWRVLMQGGCLLVRGVERKVREFEEGGQCLNCWGFGHECRGCVREVRCRRCAGFHHHTRCGGGSALRCVNCVESGVAAAATRHDARDKDCPVLVRHLRG